MDGQGNCGYREFCSKKAQLGPKLGASPAQLYDFVAHRADTHELYVKYPEIVDRLMLKLKKTQAEEGHRPERLEQPNEQLTIDQLSALSLAGAR